ncbi:hypothetical protein B0H19DRAFT_941881 [Mycena capillaripes]|nr:hypothetical protein B0H19DRAFT_941881 [Mycena capillaripes]
MNPEQPVDASANLRAFQDILAHLDLNHPLFVSSDVQRHLKNLLASWSALPPPPPRSQTQTQVQAVPPQPNARHPPLHPQADRTVEYDIPVNSKTTLSTLYRYAKGAYVEYPESGIDGPIGHLIPDDPDSDQPLHLPWTDFAYSRGSPDGGCGKDEFFYTPLLVNQAGQTVPCKTRHTTCLGVKACPLADISSLQNDYRHMSATREDVQRRLADERDARLLHSSPDRDIFLKTAAYITAVRQLGCRRPPQQKTSRTEEELQQFQQSQESAQHFRRGHRPPDTCDGRIIFHENHKEGESSLVYLRQDAGYDLDYIAAVFTGDTEEEAQIEEAAKEKDIGPLTFCKTVTNYSAQKLNCPVEHREHGSLVQHQMCVIDCQVKFRAWFPIDRKECPYVLITSQGIHRHPIPLPEKTPTAVRSQLLTLLQNLRHDLPDMTARRFLRHPAVKSYLYMKLACTVSSHPRTFPLLSILSGVLHLKRLQDQQLPEHEHYIRVVLELDNDSLPVHEEDDPPLPDEKKTRIIICMSPDSSARLQKTQYLQSDIGFKRIVGFDEFEIAAMDRDANTSVVFCRVYLTRHTAVAHQRIFDEIDKLVQQDTGSKLSWRHLHGQSPNDFDGLILHWGADQHRGQAKGLGLHLVNRAAELPPDRMDMHELDRPLRSLGPYEHLHRVYRVCKVHNYRNIQTCAVSESVRRLMRSLACIRHPHWDDTIAKILEDGGKAAADWVRDKETSKFAFPGICWEKSFIPLPIWQAGEPSTNLVEAVHSDVNREGVHCTLLGGLLRGQDYDVMQRETLLVSQSSVFFPSIPHSLLAFQAI